MASAIKLDRLFRSALDALKVVESLKMRGIKLHLLDLGGDIAGNGLSKLFLTIAAAFAEAERDRIRERISQLKADQKARGRFLGGSVQFGYRLGDNAELVPHEPEQEAVREIIAMKAQGRSLRAIAAEMQAKGYRISHEGVAGVLKNIGVSRISSASSIVAWEADIGVASTDGCSCLGAVNFAPFAARPNAGQSRAVCSVCSALLLGVLVTFQRENRHGY